MMMADKPKQEHTPLRGTIIAFISFLAVFFLLFLLLPKREFSQTENRNLQQYPAFSMKGLLFENWSAEFETFMSDQFPFRDAWVGMKTTAEFALGKRKNNGVYYAKGNMLIQEYQSNPQSIKNAKIIRKFYDTVQVPLYVGIIPDSVLVNQDALPAYALNSDQYADIQAIEAELSCPTIPICDAMLQADEPSSLYFRTDHHWSGLGAYTAYQVIIEALGHTPLSEKQFEKIDLSDTFFGTLHAKGNPFWIKPDQITGWVPKSARDVETNIFENGKCILTLDGYFSMDRLKTRDQYSVFLDGNHSRTVIRNAAGGNKKLLLIKDSFSHSLAPLLSAHYGEIHLLDLRYYKLGVNQYIKEHNIDQALILYSMTNFSSDTNLVFLGQ